MQKNPKYTQEEMYMAIEMWKESGLSQKQFCKRENLAHGTFQYWHEKYRGNNPNKKKTKPSTCNSFIPVQLSSQEETIPTHIIDDNITITYPNGVRITCPVTIAEQKLKTLTGYRPCSTCHPVTGSICTASRPTCEKALMAYRESYRTYLAATRTMAMFSCSSTGAATR